MMMPVRFSTFGADGKESLGPDTIMVGVWPGTTTVKEGQDAPEEILALLKENGVEGVEVKFREQAIKDCEVLGGFYVLLATSTQVYADAQQFVSATKHIG